jgi:hypothetical protein
MTKLKSCRQARLWGGKTEVFSPSGGKLKSHRPGQKIGTIFCPKGDPASVN